MQQLLPVTTSCTLDITGNPDTITKLHPYIPLSAIVSMEMTRVASDSLVNRPLNESGKVEDGLHFHPLFLSSEAISTCPPSE